MFDSTVPSTPISREQFTSLRRKMAKDSPKLYKNKVLSEVGNEKLQTVPKSSEVVAKPVVASEKYPKEIGSFENPVLHTLAHRTVNKELETQRLVVNIVSLAVWNLISKFTGTLATHSTWGKQLVGYLGREVSQLGIQRTFMHWYSEYPGIFKRINWQNLNFFFHTIVVCNVAISVWRLFAKVKTDDLQLNDNQKKLLGVDGEGHTSNQGHSAVEELASVEQSKRSPPEPPSTPFLFKSLETPMKTRQREQMQERQRRTQSVIPKKINAFGTLKSSLPRRPPGSGGSLNAGLFTPNMTASSGPSAATTTYNLSTPVGRTGYIPSSKYAYMMNSPSPRKRV
ncbi:POM34 (YLR018C) [Zygosaccharomyces parabailii]|uniref:BN860_08416g1_1 n=1 Tax=Zygosaccharomyces bailii (strain CLIB 213 / ATCC 58445 / CBS 680 / BCRC 21525 / NBRC 1098 / NCYC 1416 / NRRL Y-2227) TaxID=1333698 RepID=A0A8J2X760_ZYGB2|nr:POM34 (YLR018C) [Zygosaccharomyces parabailii]CDF88359.1 BN860_08416g1_1 [Zygosaccharomyces bailii CLIB 213]CDH14758.1 uncharacterized protein ZBAI_06544 [Zygosaccharomyces bailii ISA1307]